MKNIKFFLLLFFGTITTSNAQLVTLDYSTFTANPSNTCVVCNLTQPNPNLNIY